MDELDATIAELQALQHDAGRLNAVSRAAAFERVGARPTDWLVRDIMVSTDYAVLAGPKGVGKTFALLALAVAAALGERWFGRFETTRVRVLVLTSEDSEGRTWKRVDAIARALGHEPEDLEGWLYVHPLPFSVIDDADLLRAELADQAFGLVILDPAYKYMAGARSSLLFDMGAVLTPLQVACIEAGAALVVGHHYNRQEGKAREERLSGAGLLEWARVVITVEAPPRRDNDPDVVVTVEVTGNSIDPLTFRVRRRVYALDDSPNPDLAYEADVIAEGVEAREKRYRNAADRVLSVLPSGADAGLTVKEIGDLVAEDGSEKALKAATIRRALTQDLRGRVDTDGSTGIEGRWWRT